MRFLQNADGEESAARIRALLEDKGIPVVLRPDDAYQSDLQDALHIRVRVFVCLDRQFEDAQAVLRNPNHVVSGPVDAAQYHRWSAAQPLSPKLVWGGFLVLVPLALLLGLVTWLLGPNNSSKPTPLRGAA